MRRGFTLLELTLVLAVMGIVLTLTAPAYEAIVLRARSGEARLTLEAIGHAELQRWRDGQGFLACGDATAFDRDAACWRELGIRFEGSPRYRYRVELSGDHFVAIAEGDLDHDGTPGVFRMEGRTLSIASEAPLE